MVVGCEEETILDEKERPLRPESVRTTLHVVKTTHTDLPPMEPLVNALMEVLNKKRLNPKELLKSWDDNGDGIIQRDEFQGHIKALCGDQFVADEID
eukprot:939027-Prymnesium_polylepis.1